MKKTLAILSCMFSTNSWAGSPYNTNDDGVLLNGYDVVSYFQSSGPLKGNKKFQVQEPGVKYWFVNDEDKQLFLKNPKKYRPQFGGYCAYAVADSKSKVEVDPKNFLIQDGKLLLFYNGFLGDTRETWLHTKNKNPKKYLEDADKNWPEIQSEDP